MSNKKQHRDWVDTTHGRRDPNLAGAAKWREQFEADRRRRGVPEWGLGNTPPKAGMVARRNRPMPTKYVKEYPRLRIRQLNPRQWCIEVIRAEAAEPERQKPTFVSNWWAYAAAVQLLTGEEPPKPRPAPRPAKGQARATGTCQVCHYPMRPAGTSKDKYPGTRLRQRDGLCQSCNRRAVGS